jgi:predicted Zn-dependent protease
VPTNLIIFIATMVVFSCFSSSIFAADNYEKALQSYNLKKYDEAFIHLKNTLKDNSENLPAKILLAKVMLIQGNADATIKLLDEANLLRVDVNHTAVTLAKAFMQKKDYLTVVELTTNGLNPQNTFELTLQQAYAHVNLENHGAALSKYNKALAMQPNNIEVLSGLALFQLQQNNNIEVEQLLDKLLKNAPNSPQTLHLQGQKLLKSNQLPQALSFFEQAYAQTPADPILSRALANTYINLKMYSKARIVVDQVLALTPDEPFVMLLSARLYSANNENKLADEAYNNVIQKLSLAVPATLEQLPVLNFISGLADYMVGNYGSARNKLTIAIQDRNNIHALNMLVDIHLKQDQEYKALELLDNNTQLIQQSLSTSLILCRLYISADKTYKCDSLINTLQDIHGDKSTLDIMRIKVFQSYEQYAKALNLFEEKLLSNVEARVQLLAITLYQQNQAFDKALLVVNKLIKNAPNEVSYLLLKSDILLSSKQFDEADTLLTKIQTLQPDSIPAKFNRAQLTYLQEQYFESQKQVEKLLVLEPNSYRLFLLLGNSLFSQQKYPPAIEAYRKARRLSNGVTTSTEQLVKIYRLTDQLDLAMAELEKLTKANFLNPNYIQIKAEILQEGDCFVPLRKGHFSQCDVHYYHAQNI